MNPEKGMPLSRAKANISREAVATLETVPHMVMMIKITVINEAPAWLWVLLKKTWMNGKPVGDFRTSWTSPMQVR